MSNVVVSNKKLLDQRIGNIDSNKVLLPFNVTKEQVEKLIKKSNIRGGTDNISIAYLKKESGDK